MCQTNAFVLAIYNLYNAFCNGRSGLSGTHLLCENMGWGGVGWGGVGVGVGSMSNVAHARSDVHQETEQNTLRKSHIQ